MEPLLSKTSVRDLRAKLDPLLAEFAAKHNLKKLQLGNTTFDPDAGNFTFKLIGEVQGGQSREEAQMEASYKYFRSLHPELPELNQVVNIPKYGGDIKFFGHKFIGSDMDGKLMFVKVASGGRFSVNALPILTHFRALAPATEKKP